MINVVSRKSLSWVSYTSFKVRSVRKGLTKIEKHKDVLAQTSRTAKCWIQYLQYINFLKLFIWAEQTGNWEVHLFALSRMLNPFAATGHINYAISAHLHLQNMLELEINYPWVYTNFTEHGYHTVRHSNKYWAGLWIDLIIEQVLIKDKHEKQTCTFERQILKQKGYNIKTI